MHDQAKHAKIHSNALAKQNRLYDSNWFHTKEWLRVKTLGPLLQLFRTSLLAVKVLMVLTSSHGLQNITKQFKPYKVLQPLHPCRCTRTQPWGGSCTHWLHIGDQLLSFFSTSRIVRKFRMLPLMCSWIGTLLPSGYLLHSHGKSPCYS